MAKFVLGRGLGNLLEGTPAREVPKAAPLPQSSPNPGAVSSGLRVLMKEEPATPRPASEIDPALPQRIPFNLNWLRVSLVAADVVLSALAVWMVQRVQPQFGFWDGVFAFCALGTGALLSCLSLWLPHQRD